MRAAALLLGVSLAGVLASCGIGKRELPLEPPPLLDLEEPLDRRDEPADEDARLALAAGSFTGLTARAAGDSLDALLAGDAGLEVAAVVENSPADLAGVEPGDLVLEVRLDGRAETPRWPSAWRALELAVAPGTRLELVLDRAGLDRTASIVTVARARSAAREPAERFREEERVGVVLRTATEVEARAAGLGPGAGAVVTGLSRRSPWRAAGIVFGDLIRAVDGTRVEHPQVLVDAIRKAERGAELELELVRAGEARHVRAGTTSRASELHSVSVPFLFSYERDRGRVETSVLFGLYYRESTPAAWRTRLLWIFELSGGDADRLEDEADGERGTR
ncbi:MAG: PDZ domain-containing protein [Planctomycetes bacterium]|nr:PDZ domain-containing protein [Planctomycetota bacterium]